MVCGIREEHKLSVNITNKVCFDSFLWPTKNNILDKFKGAGNIFHTMAKSATKDSDGFTHSIKIAMSFKSSQFECFDSIRIMIDLTTSWLATKSLYEELFSAYLNEETNKKNGSFNIVHFDGSAEDTASEDDTANNSNRDGNFNSNSNNISNNSTKPPFVDMLNILICVSIEEQAATKKCRKFSHVDPMKIQVTVGDGYIVISAVFDKEVDAAFTKKKIRKHTTQSNKSAKSSTLEDAKARWKCYCLKKNDTLAQSSLMEELKNGSYPLLVWLKDRRFLCESLYPGKQIWLPEGSRGLPPYATPKRNQWIQQ
eukprot:jgi/Psemu1/11307/gm1.11307_g